MWVTGPKRVSRDNRIAECGRYDEAYEQARKPSIRTHISAFLGMHPHRMPYCLGRAENRSPGWRLRHGRLHTSGLLGTNQPKMICFQITDSQGVISRRFHPSRYSLWSFVVGGDKLSDKLSDGAGTLPFGKQDRGLMPRHDTHPLSFGSC